MGLFSRKKEEKKADDKDQQKRFPQFHEEFPKYESTISMDDMDAIKDAIKPEDKPPMPLRKMTFAAVPLNENKAMQEDPRISYIEDDIQVSQPDAYKQDKTLFIKIEKYKDAIDKIEGIRRQLIDVMKVLDKINELKAEEDTEVHRCNIEINSIRDSIDNIDRMLFGK